jgi:formylglycine-generating enzyme
MACIALALVGSAGQAASAGSPQPKPGEERANPVDGAVMVWVPGTAEACPNGRFRMGSTQEEIDRLWAATGWADWKDRAMVEQPAHEVELDGLWLYKYEVTVEQYAQFLAATGYDAPQAGFMELLKAHGGLPMMCVSFDDAAAYCKWAGGALPTEAQWEYAARGPEERLFPWGDDWDRTRCNSAEYQAGRALNDGAAAQAWWNAAPQTAEAAVGYLRPVGSFPEGASWCGALDMAGNLWEWCRDRFDERFYASPAAREKNPECTTKRSRDRIMRGGSLNFDATRCRGANRNWYNPDVRFDFFGLRPVVAR